MSTTLQKLWVHVHAQSFGLDGLPLSSWMRSSLQKNCWKRWFSVEEKTTQQSKQCKSTNVLHFPPPASSEDNWWAQNDHHRILPHSEFSYLPCFLQCSFWIESGVPFAPVNSWISFVLLRNIQATFIRLSIRSAMMLPPFDASVHLQAPATTRFKKVRDAENVISRSVPTCAFNSQIPHFCHFCHVFSSDQRSSSRSRRRLPWLSLSSCNFYFVMRTFWNEQDFQKTSRQAGTWRHLYSLLSIVAFLASSPWRRRRRRRECCEVVSLASSCCWVAWIILNETTVVFDF